MTPLTLTFDVPAHIVEGLINGTLERAGGVVRDASTKQVVMWLRDTATNTISSGGISSFNPVTGVLNLVIQGVKAGISINGFNAVNQKLDSMQEDLTTTIANGFNAVNQRLDLMQGVLTITTAASILNLGVSVIGFAVIARRIKTVEEQFIKINKKIDLSFNANFRAALDLAEQAFTMNKQENRRSSALNAINRFLEAQHIYLDCADRELEKNGQNSKNYLMILCLAYIAEARCYLELEEFKTAENRLQEAKKQIRPRIEKYVDILLLPNPSMYLHPKLKDEVDLSRLTKIYRWKNEKLNENEVFKIIQKYLEWENLYSGYFDVLKDQILSNPMIEIFRIDKQIDKLKNKIHYLDKLMFSMSEMESLIETNERFETYEVEAKILSKLGIGFHEWLDLQPKKNELQNSNVMYIVFDKPIDIS